MSKPFYLPTFDKAHEIARLADITPQQAWKAIEAVSKVMRDALHKQEFIEVRGFGTFHTRIQKPFYRTIMWGRGNKVKMFFPEKIKVKFLPAKELKYMVNEGYDNDN